MCVFVCLRKPHLISPMFTPSASDQQDASCLDPSSDPTNGGAVDWRHVCGFRSVSLAVSFSSPAPKPSGTGGSCVCAGNVFGRFPNVPNILPSDLKKNTLWIDFPWELVVNRSCCSCYKCFCHKLMGIIRVFPSFSLCFCYYV